MYLKLRLILSLLRFLKLQNKRFHPSNKEGYSWEMQRKSADIWIFVSAVNWLYHKWRAIEWIQMTRNQIKNMQNVFMLCYTVPLAFHVINTKSSRLRYLGERFFKMITDLGRHVTAHIRPSSIRLQLIIESNYMRLH